MSNKIQLLASHFIFRLHMLNELERGVQTLFGIASKAEGLNRSAEERPATLDELREQWQTRLNFVQVRLERPTCIDLGF